MNTVSVHDEVQQLAADFISVAVVMGDRIENGNMSDMPAASLYYQMTDAARYIDQRRAEYWEDLSEVDAQLLAIIRDDFYRLADAVKPYL